MKKIAMLFVAAAAIGFAAPASAQTLVVNPNGVHVGVHRDHHRYQRPYRARAEWRHRDHRWNRYHRNHRGPAIVVRP